MSMFGMFDMSSLVKTDWNWVFRISDFSLGSEWSYPLSLSGDMPDASVFWALSVSVSVCYSVGLSSRVSHAGEGDALRGTSPTRSTEP